MYSIVIMNHLPLTMNMNFVSSVCGGLSKWCVMNRIIFATKLNIPVNSFLILYFPQFIYFTGTVSNNGSTCYPVSFYYLKQYGH